MRNVSPKQIREKIRAARNEIPKPYAQQASYKFSERFAQLESYQTAQTIGGFLPFDGEADPLPLMDRAIQEGKSVYVPIIVEKAQPLLFAPWTRDVSLTANRFGISEPKVEGADLITGDRLDFVITPLVAFDEACNRMGVGGGYYDRTFHFLNVDQAEDAPKETKRQPVLVGIAFEMQKVPAIKVEEHDVPLKAVVTELTLYEADR